MRFPLLVLKGFAKSSIDFVIVVILLNYFNVDIAQLNISKLVGFGCFALAVRAGIFLFENLTLEDPKVK